MLPLSTGKPFATPSTSHSDSPIPMAKQQNQEQPKQQDPQLPTVLVMGPPLVFKIHEKLFSQKFNLLKPWESPAIPLPQFLSDRAATVQAVLCSPHGPVTAQVISNLPALRLVLTSSAGLEHIDLPECRRRGIRVANAAQIFSEDVADLAVGLLIDVLRKITPADRFVKSGLWPTIGHYPLGSKLGGKQVGIVGLGSIGLEVAKRLQAFGCIISYNSRKQKPSVLYTYQSDIRQLASDCDILVICCASTEKTYHLINKEVFSLLGKNGVIVNVARGAIVDEKELVRCLVAGEIAGAGLDVFEDEPYANKELFALDNVVLSPHSAALTHEGVWAIYELILGNLEAFFSNRPLLSPVLDCE